jgi:hypothetical protein
MRSVRNRHGALAVALIAALSAGIVSLSACSEEKSAPAPATPSPAAAPPPTAAPAPAAPAPPSGARTAGLPDSYPPDLPTYPSASAVASSKDGEEGLLVAFESQDTPEKIFAYYKDALAQQGWQLEGEMSSEDQHMLIANKGERKASVMVSTEGGKTEITVTVTKDAS